MTVPLELDDNDRAVLLEVASRTLLESLVFGRDDLTWSHTFDLSWVPPRLTQPGAVFVTLERDAKLLGCVGTLRAHDSLARAVVQYTLAAAYEDTRFPGLTDDDVHHCDIELSLIGVLTLRTPHDIESLAQRLRPGIDGVLVQTRTARGTLLPSVWADVPDPFDFIEALWRKADLTPGIWPADLEVFTYQAERIVTKGPR